MANLPEMPDYFVKSVGRIIENDVGSKKGHASMSIAVSAATKILIRIRIKIKIYRNLSRVSPPQRPTWYHAGRPSTVVHLPSTRGTPLRS